MKHNELVKEVNVNYSRKEHTKLFDEEFSYLEKNKQVKIAVNESASLKNFTFLKKNE